ncbi:MULTISPECIES: hypothetical protein [Bacillus cereus group]|uniref:hypothetical protein n=1 Tax=Bacillus cereus group TaxID=86661 RepID=UPI000A771232|nr:hypothetical protein [Bacillus cereus]WPQ43969.1 hypothetical protein SH594_29880 [Bacillus cereus]
MHKSVGIHKDMDLHKSIDIHLHKGIDLVDTNEIPPYSFLFVWYVSIDGLVLRDDKYKRDPFYQRKKCN